MKTDTSKQVPDLRLAMLGMVPGNGHPYSWSAIFNGYDREEMSHCPYPGITAYLNLQPPETLGIAGASVTHIWTDDPDDAPKVSRASLVPHVVTRCEDVIGEVDAVIIATDLGGEHVARCKPFVEAGLPLFVDKPLCIGEADLRTFCSWVDSGAMALSTSALRYAKEFWPLRASTADLGELRYLSITTPKSWERYGIHALEAVYPILGPGFLSAQNLGEPGRDLLHLRHKSGADVMIAAVDDLVGSFGVLQACGTAAHVSLEQHDTYFAFKAQLVAFVDYLRSGVSPVPFEETVELMKIIIAGLRSRDEAGRKVMLTEIQERTE